LDEQLNRINDTIYSMINSEAINSIFEIGDKYDEVIDKESKGAGDQTLCYLYKRCYEGIKNNNINLVSNMLRTHQHDIEIRDEKLKSFEEATKRMKAEYARQIQDLVSANRELSQQQVQKELTYKEKVQQL